MTKNDLFITLIKIYGLYSIVSIIFSTFPSTIVYSIGEFEIIGILWIIFSSTIVLGLFYYMIKRADKISKILKLDKGFDEERIDFSNLKSIDLIKLTVLIIAGFLFIDNLPALLSNSFFAFKATFPSEIDAPFYDSTDPYHYTEWGTSALNVLIGCVMVKNFKKISVFLDQKIKV